VTADATVLGEWANDAVRDLLLQTGVKVATGTVTLTANTSDYTLDAAVMLIKHAYLDGTTDHMLTQLAPADLLEMRVRGSATSSSDGPWYYALDGADLFRVYPTPTSAGTINLTYVPKPTEMSADAHDPSNATYGGIPTEFHPALLAYMYWKAASADDDQSSGQGERYRESYEAEVRKVRKYVNGKGNVRLPRASVGSRRYVPTRNDIY
jgi:hypothetical protein